MWEIDRSQLGGRFESVELQDRDGVRAVFRGIRKFCERLDNMEKPVQANRATLHILPRARDLERGLCPGIKNSAERISTKVDWISKRRVREKKVRHQRIGVWREDRRPKVTCLAIVRAAKSDARHDGKPAEIGVRIKQLMERIESGAAIVLKTRVLRELSPQLSKAGFAFVENRSPKKGMPLNVQYDFRQTFRCLEKLVRLKTRNPGESVNWIRLRQRNHIVRNGIDAKFRLVEILHHELIAKFGQVSDAVDAFGKVRPILQAEPVSPGRN